MTSVPGQPEHDDFWLMAEVVQDLNNAGDDGVPLTKIVSDVDLDSLVYVAQQRALRAEQMLATMDPPPDLDVVYTSLWMEAFKSGVEFQKRKDRRRESYRDDPQN